MSVVRLVNQALSLAQELSVLTGHEIYTIDILEALAASGLTLKVDIPSQLETQNEL